MTGEQTALKTRKCKKQKLDTTDRQKVRKLRDEGLRIHEISNRVRISEKAIKNFIKNTEPELYGEVACRLYAMKVHNMLKAGVKPSAIASELGISAGTVWRASCIGYDVYNRRSRGI